MMNVMTFEGGYKAVIAYDPDMEMFRGEFVGLNGGADFYATDPAGLKKEGQISLNVFLEGCAEAGIPPKKTQSNFALRLEPEVYQAASLAAKASGMSLNKWINRAVLEAVE